MDAACPEGKGLSDRALSTPKTCQGKDFEMKLIQTEDSQRKRQHPPQSPFARGDRGNKKLSGEEMVRRLLIVTDGVFGMEETLRHYLRLWRLPINGATYYGGRCTRRG